MYNIAHARRTGLKRERTLLKSATTTTANQITPADLQTRMPLPSNKHARAHIHTDICSNHHRTTTLRMSECSPRVCKQLLSGERRERGRSGKKRPSHPKPRTGVVTCRDQQVFGLGVACRSADKEAHSGWYAPTVPLATSTDRLSE